MPRYEVTGYDRAGQLRVCHVDGPTEAAVLHEATPRMAVKMLRLIGVGEPQMVAAVPVADVSGVLVTCPKCAGAVPSNTPFCNRCGFPIARPIQAALALPIPLPPLPPPAPLPTGDAAIVCPHCQVRGKVKTRKVRRSGRVSLAKVGAAWVTSGISLLGTGYRKKDVVSEATCRSCGCTWTIE